MNIDIINKQVAKQNNIPLKDVEFVNKFYWQRIRQHIYSYSPYPINITNIGVLFHNKSLNKRNIELTIKKIRGVRKSRRYKENSLRRQMVIDNYNIMLRKLLALRKYYKYTN